MTGPKRRRGHTHRIYDWGPLTLVLDPESRGGLYSPRVSLILRWTRKRKDMTNWGPGCEYVTTHHRLELPLPVVSWATAWRYRRWGLRRLYRLESHAVYRLFSTRFIQERNNQ